MYTVSCDKCGNATAYDERAQITLPYVQKRTGRDIDLCLECWKKVYGPMMEALDTEPENEEVDREEPPFGAGSPRAIWYAFCQFLDELSHALGFDNFEWGFRFCQWSHGYDWYRKDD